MICFTSILDSNPPQQYYNKHPIHNLKQTLDKHDITYSLKFDKEHYPMVHIYVNHERYKTFWLGTLRLDVGVFIAGAGFVNENSWRKKCFRIMKSYCTKYNFMIV